MPFTIDPQTNQRVPLNVGGGQTAPTNTSSTDTTDKSSAIKNMMILDLLSGGKNLTKLQTLNTVFTPTSDQLAKTEADKTAQQNKDLTKSIVGELLNRDTGAVTGVKNPLKYLTGEAQYTSNLVKQLQSKLSLEGRAALKGSGQISDFEAKMLEKSASALATNLSNADFKTELLKVQSILNGEIPATPEAKKPFDLMNYLKTGTASGKFVQDVTAGINQNLGGTQKANDNAIVAADQAMQKAMQITDPATKIKALKIAQQMYGESGKMADQTASEFSTDATKNPLVRGLNVGSEVATVADAASMATKIPSLVKTLPTAIAKGKTAVVDLAKNLFKTKSPESVDEILNVGKKVIEKSGKARNVIIDQADTVGRTIDGSKLAEEITRWGDNAIKAGEKSSVVEEKVLTAIKNLDGKQLLPSEAKDLWDIASSGFKASGEAGKTVTAGYQRALRDALRKELEVVAPGFEKKTAEMAGGFAKEKILKSVRDSITKSTLKESLTKEPLLKRILKGAGSKVGEVGAGLVVGAGGVSLINSLKGK